MSTERPNVVLITADQWRGDCLGCANVGRQNGTRHPVMTPHLDQLAAEGARFTQAYADCPVCMPQRVTTLTGWTASHFGLTHNFSVRSPIGTAAGYAPSLPARLTREAGYQTKAIGKMHFMPDRARMGFEHITLHPNDYVIWLEDTPYAGMYRGHGLGGNEVYPAVAPMPERFTHTHWVVEQAIRFLAERDPECPFFLWLVFEAPHSPFDPPVPYDRMYDNFSIPDPVWGDWVEGDAYPPDFIERRLSHKYDHLSEETIREARRRYYGQVSHIDYQLGRFLGELRTRRLYDETALIFTADHGEHLGDHGLFAKTTFLNSAARVPLIVRLPSGVPKAHAALEIASPTMTADICPTILQLAGLSPHTPMDGMSLLPAMARGEGDADRVICGEYGGEHSLDHVTAFATDGAYKYLYYVNGGIEQLFDTRHDPDDLHDLAQEPDLRGVRDRLRRALVDYLTKFDRPIIEDIGDFRFTIDD
ncbi:MAG: sulfatase-like hydrolase/transferase [Anaerolineae bacterium]